MRHDFHCGLCPSELSGLYSQGKPSQAEPRRPSCAPKCPHPKSRTQILSPAKGTVGILHAPSMRPDGLPLASPVAASWGLIFRVERARTPAISHLLQRAWEGREASSGADAGYPDWHRGSASSLSRRLNFFFFLLSLPASFSFPSPFCSHCPPLLAIPLLAVCPRNRAQGR